MYLESMGGKNKTEITFDLKLNRAVIRFSWRILTLGFSFSRHGRGTELCVFGETKLGRALL